MRRAAACPGRSRPDPPAARPCPRVKSRPAPCGLRQRTSIASGPVRTLTWPRISSAKRVPPSVGLPAILRNRDFDLYWVGVVASQIGTRRSRPTRRTGSAAGSPRSTRCPRGAYPPSATWWSARSRAARTGPARLVGCYRSPLPGWGICGMPCRTPTGCSASTSRLLARIIEPTSKLDSLRVLEEVGIRPPSYPTVNRRLPVFAKESWRERLAALCAHHVGLGPPTLLLYNVTTLYFETDTDGFRESGFSTERRLEPQITVGLLTDTAGVPVDGQRVRGRQGRDHHDAAGDQGVPGRPPSVRCGHRGRCRDDLGEQHEGDRGRRALVHPRHEDQVRYYQYKHDRARRTLKGIDEQVRKAEQAVAGKTAVKRNRFVKLTDATKTVNRSRRVSGSPSPTWPPVRSTTAPKIRSRRT